MIQALAITGGIRFNKKLINEIRTKNLDIHIAAVSTAKAETERILSVFNPDIILLDKRAIRFYDQKFIKKYQKIIVVLSNIAYNDLFTEEALSNIDFITRVYDFEKNKYKIAKELEYIGYEFKYKGTHYLLDTILELYIQNTTNIVDNLQSDIYPIIAEKYNKTVYNVKSSIGKATDCMYYTCDVNKLVNYFHLSYDAKPTPKQVVFTVINRISK